jgi:hypothetical protein
VKAVAVDGLKATRRGLNQIDKALTKELGKALKAIGEDVAVDARARVPQRSGRAAKSIRAGSSGNTAYVAGGRKTVRYYGWLDFGTRNPQRGNPRSDGPWKKSGTGPKGGRFIYPAIDANREMIRRRAIGALEIAKEDAFRGADHD